MRQAERQDLMDYYDPARQDIDAEHEGCVVEDGVRWFGHGMECRRPELHPAPQSFEADPTPYIAANGNRFTPEQARLITERLRYDPRLTDLEI